MDSYNVIIIIYIYLYRVFFQDFFLGGWERGMGTACYQLMLWL